MNIHMCIYTYTYIQGSDITTYKKAEHLHQQHHVYKILPSYSSAVLPSELYHAHIFYYMAYLSEYCIFGFEYRAHLLRYRAHLSKYRVGSFVQI